MGVEVGFVNAFPVVHVPSRRWRKTLLWALRSDMYYERNTVYVHGRKTL